MRRRPFRHRNRVGRSMNRRSEQPAKDLVRRSIVSTKPVTEVETSGVSGVVQLRCCCAESEAIRRCDDDGGGAVARLQDLLYACVAVTGSRLDEVARGSAEAGD